MNRDNSTKGIGSDLRKIQLNWVLLIEVIQIPKPRRGDYQIACEQKLTQVLIHQTQKKFFKNNLNTLFR